MAEFYTNIIFVFSSCLTIGEKIVAPREYDGTMDSLLFETWFEHHFLPVIKTGTAIVMDNASFNRKKRECQLNNCVDRFINMNGRKKKHS